jgi:hypothetical protein
MDKVETKICQHCGETFQKPKKNATAWPHRKYCSRKCANESRDFHKARHHWRAPCRICGNPTHYNMGPTHRNYHNVHCNNPDCVEQSHQIRCGRLSQTLIAQVMTGEYTPPPTNGWKPVAKLNRISAEELLLLDWFTKRHWKHQFHVKTGLYPRGGLPGCFDLDFALPSKKLYVEVDGTIHNSDKAKALDQRKDSILSEMGWKGLRISARLIRKDPEKATDMILEFRSLNS